MATRWLPLVVFNRGLISRLGLARQDVKRIALSAQRMRNWMPRVLGSMSIRPGLGYLGNTKSNAATKLIEFIFSPSDKALLEMTDSVMRAWVSDALVTRPAVTTAVTNGTFTTDLSSWTDSDQSGAASTWSAPGYMQLVGTGTNAAIREQQVTVAGANIGVEHALRIVIARGPVLLRVGSSSGGDQYISETTLLTGTHSLTLTPTGDFYVRFFSRLLRLTWVDSCTIEAAGAIEVPTPWPASVLGLLRWDESADVVFVACYGYQQRRIERRSTRSWSVVLYQSDDGPFLIQNTGPITLTASVLSGNGTLTASAAIFKATHVSALFALTSTGQNVSATFTAVNDMTNSIRVTGVGTDRTFTIILTGLTATGNTVVLERSFDNAIWASAPALSGTPFTADTTGPFPDGLDNQIVYYRLRCSVYAAGATAVALSITTGSIRGVCRVTAFTSSTLVSVEVLTPFGTLTATSDWEEGQWSDYRGWPSAVAFYEGRLWWAGKDAIIGSVSDAFNSFNPETTGDSGPINRTIGGAQVDTINWVLGLQRLLLGGGGGEYSCKSSSLDEPLTPSNFNPKKASTQGSAAVRAVALDNQALYVQRGGTRVFTSVLGGESISDDYGSNNLCQIVPEIGQPEIVRLGIQRQPDTRLHCVRSDGTVAILVFDPNEQVTCWVDLDTDGLVEDVAVLPGDSGDSEDHVYYVVARTINGATVRFLERWAFQSDCVGGTLNKLGDAYVTYAGAATTTISAPHLANEQVVVWADGVDIGTAADGTRIYTLDGSGNATLSTAVSSYMVGLYYEAPYQSGKLLELQTYEGTVLNKILRIAHLGLVLADVHPQGLRFGQDFTTMDYLPMLEDGYPVSTTATQTEYDNDPIIFPGSWKTNMRLCLLAAAPRNVTVLAATLEVEV